MDSAWQFVICVIVMAIGFTLLRFKSPSKAIEHFKAKGGWKILRGIIVFVGLPLLLVGAMATCSKANAEDNWFAFGEVFLGLDYTKGLSPQCEDRGPDPRSTSNGGVRVNIYQSSDERFTFNSKYTHNSCAFSPDRETYDALGLEATYRIW